MNDPVLDVMLPVRHAALCLDCDTLFDVRRRACPGCGRAASTSWPVAARLGQLEPQP